MKVSCVPLIATAPFGELAAVTVRPSPSASEISAATSTTIGGSSVPEAEPLCAPPPPVGAPRPRPRQASPAATQDPPPHTAPARGLLGPGAGAALRHRRVVH